MGMGMGRSFHMADDNAMERTGRTVHVSGVGEEVGEQDIVHHFMDKAGKVAAVRRAAVSARVL